MAEYLKIWSRDLDVRHIALKFNVALVEICIRAKCQAKFSGL